MKERVNFTAKLTTPHPLADKWAGESCKLNGHPAIIQGRLHRFASVYTLAGIGGVYFAWETVDRIMSRDREFKS